MINILITGSTGLIGSYLHDEFSKQGHQVYRMHRRNIGSDDKNLFCWSPDQGIIQYDEDKHIDVVIHLAGKNISEQRWNAEYKEEIISSRIESTQLLVNKLLQLENKPKLFLCASAIGFYGDTTQEVDEYSPIGTGFLSQICQQWEELTQPVAQSGIRTVNMRFGVVLSKKGGALAKMLPPFKMGLGGRVGNGKQYMSWTTLKEIFQMVQFMIENERLSGAINLVSPTPISNKDFTKALGKALNRPTVLPLPTHMVKLLFGEMGESLLLSNAQVAPRQLIQAGYHFNHKNIHDALADILKEN